MIPFINGIRHSWASITVNILGRIVSGITAVTYEETQDKQNNYGAGIYPVSRGLGKLEAKASITLHAYEVDAIMQALGPGKRITEIAPFDIVVSYLPTGQDLLVSHVIRNAEFTNNKRDIKQGDTAIQTEFAMICSHIEW